MTGKMAIVGSGDKITVFKAAGVDAYPAEDEGKAREILRRIGHDYAVIFLTEELHKGLGAFLKRFDEEPYPVILSVPSSGTSTGYSDEFLRSAMERALGVDILFNN